MSGIQRAAIALLFVMAFQPTSATAQQFEFTPNIGMYIPVGLLVEGRDVTDDSFVRRRQLGALIIGARLGTRPTRTFGVETSATYSSTLVAITDRDSTLDIKSNVLLASVRGVARVSGTFARGEWGFYVAPGVGVVRRNGVAWNSTQGTTDGAIVLAAGARLGRLRSAKAFRFGVENYITRADFDHSTTESPPRIHHDVVWSFGIAMPLGQ